MCERVEWGATRIRALADAKVDVVGAVATVGPEYSWNRNHSTVDRTTHLCTY